MGAPSASEALAEPPTATIARRTRSPAARGVHRTCMSDAAPGSAHLDRGLSETPRHGSGPPRPRRRPAAAPASTPPGSPSPTAASRSVASRSTRRTYASGGSVSVASRACACPPASAARPPTPGASPLAVGPGGRLRTPRTATCAAHIPDTPTPCDRTVGTRSPSTTPTPTHPPRTEAGEFDCAGADAAPEARSSLRVFTFLGRPSSPASASPAKIVGGSHGLWGRPSGTQISRDERCGWAEKSGFQAGFAIRWRNAT